jgi:hypothetical protein
MEPAAAPEKPRFDCVDEIKDLLKRYRTFRIKPGAFLSMKPKTASPLGLWAYEQGTKSPTDALRCAEARFGLEYVLGFNAGFSVEELPTDFRRISKEADKLADSEDFRCGVEDAQLAWEIIKAKRNKRKVSEELSI